MYFCGIECILLKKNISEAITLCIKSAWRNCNQDFVIYFSASAECILLYILNRQHFGGQNLHLVEYIFMYFQSETKTL